MTYGVSPSLASYKANKADSYCCNSFYCYSLISIVMSGYSTSYSACVGICYSFYSLEMRASLYLGRDDISNYIY